MKRNLKRYLKSHTRQWILFCVVLALLAPCCASAGARPVGYLPGVEEEMADPAFWSDLTDDPDRILATPEEIARINAAVTRAGLAKAGQAAFTVWKEQIQEAVEELAVYYGTYGDEAEPKTAELLDYLHTADPAAGAKWEKIMNLWKSVNTDPEIHEGILPDGLPETDELCLVVLGFQLNPDGSMKDELIERLKVAKASAEKYPNALIVCTGGGTAAENPSATEAGRMAEWLIANGIDARRVIVEDQSLTTAQNAIFTWKILTEQYPQVKQLAVISSDYHIATGTLLFSAEAILQAKEAGKENMTVVSNAAWHAPSGTLSPMFQAGALIELSGDKETAFEIYYETYDIHELPPLNP